MNLRNIGRRSLCLRMTCDRDAAADVTTGGAAGAGAVLSYTCSSSTCSVQIFGYADQRQCRDDDRRQR